MRFCRDGSAKKKGPKKKRKKRGGEDKRIVLGMMAAGDPVGIRTGGEKG